LHGYGDTGLRRFWGNEFDILGSCDVIGHVTIGLGIPIGGPMYLSCTVTEIYASILRRYGAPKILGSRP